MNEPTQGHLVTVPVEALHAQHTHTSFISWCEKKNKKLKLVDWLIPPPLPPLTPPPPPLCSNPHGDRRGRKRRKVSWRDIERKREINTKERTLSPQMCVGVDAGKIIPLYLHTTITVMTLACTQQTDLHLRGWGGEGTGGVCETECAPPPFCLRSRIRKA